MKFVIQRVRSASVRVEGKTIAQIKTGFLVLIGIGEGDTKEIAEKYTKKMLGLRIFPDENDKANLSLKDVSGELLLVSQFTLCADCKKGNRPSFTKAGDPRQANELYEYIVSLCRAQIPVVQTGEFGAYMQVSLENDGPFTILLDEHIL